MHIIIYNSKNYYHINSEDEINKAIEKIKGHIYYNSRNKLENYNLDIINDIKTKKVNLNIITQKISKGLCDLLVLKNYKSLGKTTREALEFIINIKNVFGCDTYILDCNLYTGNDMSFNYLQDRLRYLNLLAKQRSEEISYLKYMKLKIGGWIGGQKPYGFTFNKTEILFDNAITNISYLVPLDSEIEIVKLIYQKYLELKSANKVYKYISEIKTPGKSIVAINRDTIYSILSSSIYIKSNNETYEYFKSLDYEITRIEIGNGIFLHSGLDDCNKIAAAGYHEGIIDFSIWLEVQSLMNERKRKSKF